MGRTFKVAWSRKRFTRAQRATWKQCRACGEWCLTDKDLTIHAQNLCPILTGKKVVALS